MKTTMMIAALTLTMLACSDHERPPPAGDRTDAGHIATDAACDGSTDGGSDAATTFDGGDASSLDGATADASDAGADASLYAPGDWCYGAGLTVDSVAPAAVMVDAVAQQITLKGCGFSRVVDVEVNVFSVPFVIVDDTTIVATLPMQDRNDFGGDGLALPATVHIDIIVKPATQVQTSIVWQ